ncbi:hypothetical protein Tco_0807411, partial [Tanacetum coccineum]
IIDTTQAQQKALDDALVSLANRLNIRNCNLRLNFTLKSKEPTLQVVLDALKLTSFNNAFQITTDVPEIYMQEFWATVSVHHHSLHFIINGKSHTVNVDNFRDMLQICPNLPCQKFKDPPFEEEILSFIRDLGHTGEIKVLTYVNVNHMHQPWRSFAAIINKCLSGKTTGHDRSPGISSQEQELEEEQRHVLSTIHQSHHRLLHEKGSANTKEKQDLTNQAMLESEAYKTYYAYAIGEKTPKPKYGKKADSKTSPKKKPVKATKGKRIKATTKVSKSGKKKLPTQGLETLSEIALSEAEQMKIAAKRSRTHFNSTHASGSGVHEGTGVTPGVPDVPKYDSEDERISWKSSDEDDDDEVSLSKDDDDNSDDEDNVDQVKRQDEEDKEEEYFDQRIRIPSHYESTDDEAYDEVAQVKNVEEEKLEEAKTNEEEEVNQSSSVSSGFISNTLNPNLDISIYSILNPNIESTSLVDVPVTTSAEIPPSFATTLPPPPIPFFQPPQQTLFPTPTNISKFKQTNQFAEAFSSIPGIVDKYLANRMNDAVNAAVQLQSDRLREEA